jgi:hypothetical protein
VAIETKTEHRLGSIGKTLWSWGERSGRSDCKKYVWNG